MMRNIGEIGLALRLYLAPTIALALVALVLLPLLLLLVAVIIGLTFVCSILVDRLRARHSAPLPERGWSVPKTEMMHLTTRDGVAIRCYIARPSSAASVDKPHRVVLLCQPLGQCVQTCGLDPFTPVILGLGAETCTYITWDYRGFFGSDAPNRLRRCSIRDHAEDAVEVLALACGPNAVAEAVVGHSMGVQVALEFCLLRPELVGSLVLLNGTSGHALRTGLQPIVALPWVGELLSTLISRVLAHEQETWLEALWLSFQPINAVVFPLYARLFGSPVLRRLLGRDYIFTFWNSYLGGICSNRRTMRAFFRGFQELDAHSVDHLLYQVP